MKRALIILMSAVISITFASCASNETKTESKSTNNDVTTSITTSKPQKDTTTKKQKSSDKITFESSADIEKVIIDMANKTTEYECDDFALNMLNNIAACEEKPKIDLTNKIGTITIKYKDGKTEEYADLYFGGQNNLYAKYNKNTNDEIAYEIELASSESNG